MNKQLAIDEAPSIAGNEACPNHGGGIEWLGGAYDRALRTVVTKQTPLTAPGSLDAKQYAALMAFLLAANCVAPSRGGTSAFPTSDSPALARVTLVGASCAIK